MARKKGRPQSAETRAKIAAAVTGHTMSPEGRDRIAESNRRRAARKRGPLSPEARANVAAANRRRAGQKRGPRPPEVKAKIAAKLLGHPTSPEAKAKMTAKLKDRPLAPEHAANVAAANRRRAGRKHTPEAKAKIAAARTGKKHSPDTRANLSAARKGCLYVPRNLADLVKPILDQHRAGRPESATSATRPESATSPGRSVSIGDMVVSVSSEEQARVLEVLRREPRPLSLEEIGEKAGLKSPRHVVSKLQRHPVCGPLLREETRARRRKYYQLVYTR